MHSRVARRPLVVRPSWSLAALVLAAACVVWMGNGAPNPVRHAHAGTAATTSAPLSFIPNRGQSDARVLYESRANGVGLAFGRDGVAMSLGRRHVTDLTLGFVGANPRPEVTASRLQAGRVNYLVGNDPSKWHRNLPTYSGLSYASLWHGIDMRFVGKPGNLKYEFSVAPGADASDIGLAYTGATGLSVASDGALRVATGRGRGLRDAAPTAYQVVGGRRVPVRAAYRLGGGNRYGFTLGHYDHSRALVVDPGIEYASYLGGYGSDEGDDVAVDGTGAAYVTGWTDAADFPKTAGAYDSTSTSGVIVSKFAANGGSLVYSTILGGNSSLDYGYGIAVDGSQQAHVTGYTESTNFPVTAGAGDTTMAGGDNFVTTLSANGASLVGSTFLGGSGGESQNPRIVVDSAGNSYVGSGTSSNNLPGATNSYGGGGDAYVSKLTAAGGITWSSYVGGSGYETGADIALGPSDTPYVVGQTQSNDLPTTAGAYDTTYNGGGDTFVAKLSSAGTSLTYSTYLGGASSDYGRGIAVDSTGAAYVGSGAGPDYPTTSGAFQTSAGGGANGAVTKLNPAGSQLVYSTFLSGNSATFIDDVDVFEGKAYLAGDTSATNFPTTPDAFDSTQSNGDGFLTVLNTSGTGLVYSTLFGGSNSDTSRGAGIDSGGKAYITGFSYSYNFPVTSGAPDKTNSGASASYQAYDAFLIKIDPGVPPQCSDGIDNDGDGAVDYPADPGCSSAFDDTEYTAPVASTGGTGSVAPISRPSSTPVARTPSCGRRVISLVRADAKGKKVTVSGLVGQELYGKKVTITGNYKVKGKTAKVTVKATSKGTFSGKLDRPSSAKFANARYRAASGSAKSIDLKLFQAMTTSSIKLAAGKITLKGSIRRSLLGKRNAVVVRRLVCGKYRTVATVKPSASGSYTASFSAKGVEGSALYRAEGTVLVRKGSRKYAKAYARAVSIRVTGSTG